jgi:hypothetical protein
MALQRTLTTVLGASLFFAGLLAAPRHAASQITADPYKPYNAAFEPYVYSYYSDGNAFVPNSPSTTGRIGSESTFRRFLEEEDELGRAAAGPSTMPGRRGIGVPYYRAHHDYDQAYGRVYSPNRTADEAYLTSRRTRDDLYAQYLRELDPKRKAALLKEYREYNQQAMRQLSESGRGAPTRRPAARTDGRARPRPPIPGTEAAGRAPSSGAAGAVRPRPPLPGSETTRSRTGANAAARRPADAAPSPSETLRRSEAADGAARRRPPAPSDEAR